MTIWPTSVVVSIRQGLLAGGFHQGSRCVERKSDLLQRRARRQLAARGGRAVDETGWPGNADDKQD
jgi:hypothetical protein